MTKRNPTKTKRTASQSKTRIIAAIQTFTEGVAQIYDFKPELALRSKRRPRQLLTAKQAGTLLGVAPKTLANWRTLGTGPKFHKTGGKILYLRRDLVAFARSRKVSSTSAYTPMPLHGGSEDV